MNGTKVPQRVKPVLLSSGSWSHTSRCNQIRPKKSNQQPHLYSVVFDYTGIWLLFCTLTLVTVQLWLPWARLSLQPLLTAHWRNRVFHCLSGCPVQCGWAAAETLHWTHRWHQMVRHPLNPEGLPPHAVSCSPRHSCYLPHLFFPVKADISTLFLPLDFISSLFSSLHNEQVHKCDRTAWWGGFILFLSTPAE